METQLTNVTISKSVTLRTKSPYRWFYFHGGSIDLLHNKVHNTLSIVIPEADCHIEIKLFGSPFKKEATLLKIYSKACEKYGIKNIFSSTK